MGEVMLGKPVLKVHSLISQSEERNQMKVFVSVKGEKPEKVRLGL